jgi:hypothetical protein
MTALAVVAARELGILYVLPPGLYCGRGGVFALVAVPIVAALGLRRVEDLIALDAEIRVDGVQGIDVVRPELLVPAVAAVAVCSHADIHFTPWAVRIIVRFVGHRLVQPDDHRVVIQATRRTVVWHDLVAGRFDTEEEMRG